MLFKLLCSLPLVLATGWGCGWRSAMHAFVFAFKFCFGFSSFGTWAAFGFALALLSSNGSEATGCVVGGQRCARESSQSTLDNPLVASGLPLWTKPGTARPPCRSIPIHMCFKKSVAGNIISLERKTKVSNYSASQGSYMGSVTSDIWYCQMISAPQWSDLWENIGSSCKIILNWTSSI